MHEISTAQSILESATEIAKEHGISKIFEIIVTIGEFAILTDDQLLSAINIIIEDYPIMKGVRITTNQESGKYECLDCGYKGRQYKELTRTGSHDSPLSVGCKRCGSTDTILTEGTKIFIDKIIS